jgi:hypothetical protein
VKVHYRSRLARLFLPRRYLAITVSSHVLTRESHLDERVLRHEQAHVEQWKCHGRVRFLARYLWFHFRYGYDRNPFELEACRAEAEGEGEEQEKEKEDEVDGSRPGHL